MSVTEVLTVTIIPEIQNVFLDIRKQYVKWLST